jgi:MFS family permease
MKSRIRTFELISLNCYWLGLSFMWNSLHVLVLPAVLLLFVPDERKNTILGLMTFIGLIVAMTVQPISGALSDSIETRFGRRRPWIAFGTLFDLIFLGLMAIAGGLPLLATAYIGLQFTSNLAHGPAQGLMHDRVPSEQMGVASGVKNFFEITGLILSSLLVGRILTEENPNLAIIIITGFLIVGAIFTLLGVREQISHRPKDERDSTTSRFQLPNLDFHAHRDFWRLIASRLLFLVGVYGIQTFAQYFIRDTVAVEDPVKLTGDLLATIALTLIGFSVVAGYLCDRLGRKPMHVAAVMFVVVGSLLMTTAQSSFTILVFGCVIGAGIGLFISANWALANDLAPKGEGGKYLGLTNLATAGAGALSRLAGPGIDALNAAKPGSNFGYDGLFVGAAIFAIISLLILTQITEVRSQPGPVMDV